MPPIALAIIAVRGWPLIRDAVSSVEATAARVGGEVIATHASDSTPPPSGALAATTTWQSRPRTSAYQLRVLGYAQATAPIVAVTEDHCLVPDEWAQRLLAARVLTAFLRSSAHRSSRMVASRGRWLGSTRGHATTVTRVWPLMLWLHLVQAAGNHMGFALGPGDSPREVR